MVAYTWNSSTQRWRQEDHEFEASLVWAIYQELRRKKKGGGGTRRRRMEKKEEEDFSV
jgi:hypothetical protein